MMTRRLPHIVAFGLLSLSAWAVWAGRPAASLQALQPAPTMPMQIGAWVGHPVAVDARTIEILETDDVTLVDYHAPDHASVSLARVAGFGNRAAFHPPELCFVGSHFDVLDRAPIDVAIDGRTHRVMRLVVRQGTERFEAWYWFTANGRVTHNYYRQQWWLLGDSLRGRPSSGTLMRLLTSDADGRAGDRLRAFFDSLQVSVRS